MASHCRRLAVEKDTTKTKPRKQPFAKSIGVVDLRFLKEDGVLDGSAMLLFARHAKSAALGKL